MIITITEQKKSIFALIVFLLCSAGLLFSGQASAHFVLDARTRILQLTTAEQAKTILPASAAGLPADGLCLFMRVPAPLVYARALSQRAHPTARVSAPYLREEIVDGIPYYHLDHEAIAADRQGFAQFVAGGYAVAIDDVDANDADIDAGATTAKAVAVTYHDNRYRPHFNALDGVAESFAIQEKRGDFYVGQSVIDIALHLPEANVDSTVAIRSVLPEIVLPPDVDLLNIAYDHRQQPPLIVQKNGQMTQTIALSGSQGASFIGFIIDGIEHILIGTDHVLFVLCLTMAAGLSWRILWSVTGFTLGHSVTFALGAFGIFPQAAWFIPLVEWIIAASIIVAALLIFVQSRRTAISGWNLFLLTAFIGLIHGYGFAFVFSELVGDIRQQVMALMGFNIGVEIGQLMIVAAAMLVLWLLAQWHRYLALGLRFTTAVIAISIAAYWVYERGQSVLAALYSHMN